MARFYPEANVFQASRAGNAGGCLPVSCLLQRSMSASGFGTLLGSVAPFLD